MEFLHKARLDKPDGIIMDINMPDLNADEGPRPQGRTSLLAGTSGSAKPMYDKIPIIITTSSDARSDQQKATAAGADDDITKSFDSEILKVKMNQLCTHWLR
jgi:CheY-like chemotaxis protein